MLELLALSAPGILEIKAAPERPDEPSLYRKPSPRFILEKIAEHGLDPTRCWMTGDRVTDWEAGLNAGIRSCAMRSGAAKPEELLEAARRGFAVHDDFPCFRARGTEADFLEKHKRTNRVVRPLIAWSEEIRPSAFPYRRGTCRPSSLRRQQPSAFPYRKGTCRPSSSLQRRGRPWLFFFGRAAVTLLLFFGADEGGGESEDTDGEGQEFEELGVHDGNIWLVNSSPSQSAGGHSGQ
jgi:hypothetical protein